METRAHMVPAAVGLPAGPTLQGQVHRRYKHSRTSICHESKGKRVKQAIDSLDILDSRCI